MSSVFLKGAIAELYYDTDYGLWLTNDKQPTTYRSGRLDIPHLIGRGVEQGNKRELYSYTVVL